MSHNEKEARGKEPNNEKKLFTEAAPLSMPDHCRAQLDVYRKALEEEEREES